MLLVIKHIQSYSSQIPTPKTRMIQKSVRALYAFILTLRNVRFFFTQSPATPLRTGLISAFDYIALLHGISLSNGARNDAALFTDFASLLNRYYDGKSFDYDHYISLRVRMRSRKRLLQILPSYRRIIKSQSQNKKLTDSNEILSARERETRAIFDAICQLFALPVDSLNTSTEKSRTPLEEDIFSLLHLGYLIQMYDDILDSDYDRKYSIPSYVTAFMLTRGISKAQALYLCFQHAKRHLTLIAQTPSQAQVPLYLVGICTYWLGRASSLRYHL